MLSAGGLIRGWRAVSLSGRAAAIGCGQLRELNTTRQHAMAAPIETVAVIGSGLMGSGIAQVKKKTLLVSRAGHACRVLLRSAACIHFWISLALSLEKK